MIIATYFGAFCLFSATLQFVYFSFRRKPSPIAYFPDEPIEAVPEAEVHPPYLLLAALEARASRLN
jgi:hypothetical protein